MTYWEYFYKYFSLKELKAYRGECDPDNLSVLEDVIWVKEKERSELEDQLRSQLKKADKSIFRSNRHLKAPPTNSRNLPNDIGLRRP
jgi:DNA-binding transcriptional MerR regulator